MELFLIFFAVWRCLEAGWDLEAIILEAGRAGSWKMEAWGLKLGTGNLSIGGFRGASSAFQAWVGEVRWGYTNPMGTFYS